MQPSDEGLYGITLPLEEAFDAPVHEVAHPAIYPQLLGLALGGISEVYSLHQPRYAHPNPYFCHRYTEYDPSRGPRTHGGRNYLLFHRKRYATLSRTAVKK